MPFQVFHEWFLTVFAAGGHLKSVFDPVESSTDAPLELPCMISTLNPSCPLHGVRYECGKCKQVLCSACCAQCHRGHPMTKTKGVSFVCACRNCKICVPSRPPPAPERGPLESSPTLVLAGFGLDATTESVRSHLEGLGIALKSVSVDQARRILMVTFEALSDAERFHSIVSRSIVLVNLPAAATRGSLASSLPGDSSVALAGSRAVCTFRSELDLWFVTERLAAADQNCLQVRCNFVHPVSNHVTVSDSRGVRFPHLVERAFRGYGESRKLPPDVKIVEALSVQSVLHVDFAEEQAARNCAATLSLLMLADGTPVRVRFFHPR
jgi:hypothetical protein